MPNTKTRWTLGELIRLVSQLAQDNHETSLVVADMLNRRIVKARGRHKYFKVVGADQ